MTKAIVETVGPYSYQDLSLAPPGHIPHDRPRVVEVTPYVSTLIAQGKVLLKHALVPENGTDAEFVRVLAAAEGDVELAIASFISELTDEPELPTLAPKKGPVRKGA